jgi:CheY-like chemotaxis protein
MPMKILIAEDNSQMRRLIRSVVADLAATIAECDDGEEAVGIYTAQDFSGADWVLMDLQMPRLGGLESTRQIREAHPDARIIIVTQYDDPHWRAAATQAGACGYVLKENLLAVRELIGKPLNSKSGFA